MARPLSPSAGASCGHIPHKELGRPSYPASSCKRLEDIAPVPDSSAPLLHPSVGGKPC